MLRLAVCLAVIVHRVHSFGFVTRSVNTDTRPHPGGQAATVCVKWNATANSCLAVWAAQSQAVPTLGAGEIQSFKRGTTPYLAIANLMFLDYKVPSYILRYEQGSDQFTVHQTVDSEGTDGLAILQTRNETFLALAQFTDGHTLNMQSGIYGLNENTMQFQRFQNVSTSGARDWESAEIDGEHYLIVANSRNPEEKLLSNSTVYRWNNQTRLFVAHQHIVTVGALDVHCFTIGSETLLAVANHGASSNYVQQSVIYRWNTTARQFVELQRLVTVGATAWDNFVVNGSTYLVVSHYRLTMPPVPMASIIYRYDPQQRLFQWFQNVTTLSPMEVSSFYIGGVAYIAFANSQTGATFLSNSSIWRWSTATSDMQLFQHFTTLGANSMHVFEAGGQPKLAVANRNSGMNFGINSFIYKHAALFPLSVNATHVTMYVLLGDAFDVPCLFPGTKQGTSERFIEAYSAGFRFGLKVWSESGNGWYACDVFSSAIDFWSVYEPLPVCAQSGVFQCGIISEMWPFLAAGTWTASLHMEGSELAMEAAQPGAFRIEGENVTVTSAAYVSCGAEGVTDVNVFGTGWKRDDLATLNVTASVDGKICIVRTITPTSVALRCTCPITTSSILQLQAGNQVVSRILTLSPSAFATSTPVGTISSTRSSTALATSTGTRTNTVTASHSVTRSASATASHSMTSSRSVTSTTTQTASLSASATHSPSASTSATHSSTVSLSVSAPPTQSSTASFSAIASFASSQSPSPTVTGSSHTSASSSHSTPQSAAVSLTSSHSIHPSQSSEPAITQSMTATYSHASYFGSATAAAATTTAYKPVSPSHVKMVLGCQHMCLLHDSAALYCWGNNHYGQCGYAAVPSSSGVLQYEDVFATGPIPLLQGAQITHVAASCKLTCAALRDQHIVCFGVARHYNHSLWHKDANNVYVAKVRYVSFLTATDRQICAGGVDELDSICISEG